MGKQGLLTPEKFKKLYAKDVRSLLDALRLAIKKYKLLLANWDMATARKLWEHYIGVDTCALCRFFATGHCEECPLYLSGLGSCTDNSRHPFSGMAFNLKRNRKARARKCAEKILALLEEKAKEMKDEEKGRG